MFPKIADLKPSNDPISILGFVVAKRDARKSRGDDIAMSVVLKDETFSFCSHQNLNVNLFQRNMNDLPVDARIGDVLMLRNIKIKAFENSINGISTFGFGFAIYRWDSARRDLFLQSRSISCLPDGLQAQARELYFSLNPELAFGRQHVNCELTFGRPLTDPQSSLHPAKQFKPIPQKSSSPLPLTYKAEELEFKEMKIAFLGEVLQITHGQKAQDKLLILLTDYSTNEHLPLRQESFPGIPNDAILPLIVQGKSLVDCIRKEIQIGDYLLFACISVKPKDDQFLKFKIIAQESGGQENRLFTKIEKNSVLLKPLLEAKQKIYKSFDWEESEDESESEEEETSFPKQEKQSATVNCLSLDGLQSQNNNNNNNNNNNQIQKESQDLFVDHNCSSKNDNAADNEAAGQEELKSLINLLLKSKKPVKIPNQHLFTFHEIQTFSSQGEPIKFICKFRIKSTIPRKTAHLTLAYCVKCHSYLFESEPVLCCSTCNSSLGPDELFWAYCFVLEAFHPERPDKIYHVVVDGEEAEKFLGGIMPVDFKKNAYSCHLARETLDAIIKGGLQVNAVVVRSYDARDKAVRFKISRFLFFDSPDSL